MTPGTVHGLENVEQALGRLEVAMQKTILRKGLRRAGNVVRDDARSRAPRKEGLLRRSIVTRVGFSRSAGQWGAQVGVFPTRQRKDGKKSKDNAFYAAWVHEGHLIVPRGRSRSAGFTQSAQRTTRKAARTEARSANRRTRPDRFLFSSIQARQDQARQVLMDELRKGIAEETQRASRPTEELPVWRPA